MFAKNSMRVAAAALVLSFLALAGGAARAADGDQFVKTWHGNYSNTKGDKVADSTIVIKRSGGDLTGDWDGYDIASAVVSGDTLTWTCASKAKAPGPNDVNGYYMTATLAGGKLHVKYKAVSGALIILGVISAQPEGKNTEKEQYTGSGDFK